jgi:hypothetical protein
VRGGTKKRRTSGTGQETFWIDAIDENQSASMEGMKEMKYVSIWRVTRRIDGVRPEIYILSPLL